MVLEKYMPAQDEIDEARRRGFGEDCDDDTIALVLALYAWVVDAASPSSHGYQSLGKDLKSLSDIPKSEASCKIFYLEFPEEVTDERMP